MPDPTTGVTVGTSIYGVVSGKNAADDAAAAAKRQGKRLDAATQRQLDMAQEQLDMEKERYAKWQGVYGSIEENLGKAYARLDPAKYAARNVVDFEKKRGEAMQRVKESLAQRNITKESGISTAVLLADKLNAAQVKAGIRANAEDEVMAKQQSFLQVGLQQNVVPNAGYQSVQNALGTQTRTAERALDIATQQNQIGMKSAAQAGATFIKEAGTALADYMEKGSVNNQLNELMKDKSLF